MDLGSTNGTFINVSLSLKLHPAYCLDYVLDCVVFCGCENLITSEASSHFISLFTFPSNIFYYCFQDSRVEPQRYYELFEKDTIKFGNSRYAISKDTFFDCCDL